MNRTPESKTNAIILVMLIGFISAFFWYYLKDSIIAPISDSVITPFHWPISIFCDYYAINNTFNQSGFYGDYNYLTGGITLLQILKFISLGNPYYASKIILFTYFFFSAFYVYKMTDKLSPNIRYLAIIILVFFNYPILFVVHTANFEGFVLILMIFSYLYYKKNRIDITFFLIGVAGAIKIFPLFIWFVYVKKDNFFKSIKYTSFGFLIAFISPFIISLFYYPHGNIADSFMGWVDTLTSGTATKMYKDTMVVGYNGVFFGHSLLNSIRLIMTPNEGFMFAFMTKYYLQILLTSAGLILFSSFISFKIKSVIYRYIFILAALCLFRPTSTDYYLVQFFVPFVALMMSDLNYKYDFKILIATCILLLSKNYYIFFDNNYITSNTIINSLTLLFIYFIIILNPKSRESD